LLSEISDNKDKPSTEGTVGIIETWIMAALRNRKFFTFADLNRAIRKKLKEFHEKPFQKKEGSRLSAFEQEEKSYLLPLPASPYETAVWSKTTIQPDYLIHSRNCKYSVPYEYIGKEVEVRTTEKCLEVFYHGHRIAAHAIVAVSSEPIYLPEHMPENHKKFLSYHSETFLEWADHVGVFTHMAVKNFLTMHKVEQQGYKSCASLMKLADKYSLGRLEKACEKAFSYTPSPSLKNITTILKNGQDKISVHVSPNTDDPSRGITRGASYYGGGANP
jgi:hypothetical protein